MVRNVMTKKLVFSLNKASFSCSGLLTCFAKNDTNFLSLHTNRFYRRWRVPLGMFNALHTYGRGKRFRTFSIMLIADILQMKMTFDFTMSIYVSAMHHSTTTEKARLEL